MTKIKICGLRREIDAEYVNAVRPDFAGMILTPGFKRSIDEETARRISGLIDPKTETVGVFVNEKRDVILSCLERGIIDTVQLHGDETADYIAKIKQMTGCKVIKAVKIRSKDDIKAAAELPADFILFDNGTGTGQCFDWNILREELKGYTGPKFFIAGGINEENVKEAITFKPYAIDVSGGVETDGFKDPIKMRKLTEMVRNRR